MSSNYRASLIIIHPHKKVCEIAGLDKVCFTKNYCRNIGERRSGSLNSLKVNKITSVSYKLHEKPISYDDMLIEDYLLQLLTNLEYVDFKNIVLDGGQAFLLLGVYSDRNVMLHCNLELITLLNNKSLGLKLDFYGGAD
jgi:hypothetical protein